MSGVLPLGTPLRQRYGRHRSDSKSASTPERPAQATFRRDEVESVFLEDWSRNAARVFLGWLGAPAGGRWLDVGCGLGILTQTILEHTAPIEVIGIDPSTLHIAGVETGITDFRARFQVGNLDRLRFSSRRFDAVASGLCLDAVPDADRTVAELARVTRANGVVGTYVWDFDEGLQIMHAFWSAAEALDRAALLPDDGRRSATYRPGRLAEIFKRAGLHDVEARGLAVPTPFAGVNDFWCQLNTGGSGHLATRGPAADYLHSLSEDQRNRLRELLEHNLSGLEDGITALTARIWAVKGIK